MTRQAPSQPNLTPDKAAGKDARKDRLAAEMRRNLMKRKQQQRRKSEGADSGEADGRERRDGD